MNTSVSSSISDDLSNFDIHKYVTKYKGQTKIHRLSFIIFETVINSNVKYEAAESMLNEIKKSTSNTTLYSRTLSKINEFMDIEPKFDSDNSWISTTDSLFFSNLEKIENELTIAKSTMSKESMRLKYLDLGYLYYERGNIHLPREKLILQPETI